MAIDGLPRGTTFVLDPQGAGLDLETVRLLEQEVEEFEAVLGTRVRVGVAAAGQPCWRVLPRPGPDPALVWDAATATLTSHADGPAEYLATLQLLHTLAHVPGTAVVSRAPSGVDEATEVIRRECALTYPSLGLRGVDWEAVCAQRLASCPTGWAAFEPWAAEWVARLGDAHTCVVDRSTPTTNSLYVGELHRDGVRLLTVPPRSEAAAAGVRPGWVVAVADPDHWLRTTGASPQQHRRAAARRAMAIRGDERAYSAHEAASGRTATWVERARPSRPDELVEVDRTASGALLLTLRAVDPRSGLHDVLDDVCAGSGASDHLVLDLRGNTGGSIRLATSVRDRFLRERTHIGSIAFTDGRGGLAPRRDRWAEPSEAPRWAGRLTVLTDASTYSASEDLLLGLQGLDHVRVLGERTGGGSGRPRVLPLGPGLALRISTAITYDRLGNPVELRGIVPDGPLTGRPEDL